MHTLNYRVRTLVNSRAGLPANFFFRNYDGFLLMLCNFKYDGVLFQSDSRHNDRVDSIWECVTKQAGLSGLPPSGPAKQGAP